MPGAAAPPTVKLPRLGPKLSSVRSEGPADVASFSAPVMAPVGTATVTWVSVHACGAQATAVTSSASPSVLALPSVSAPRKTTLPGVEPKPVPVMVTSVPTPALIGLTDWMNGRSSHWCVAGLQKPDAHCALSVQLEPLQAPQPDDAPQSTSVSPSAASRTWLQQCGGLTEKSRCAGTLDCGTPSWATAVT